MSLHYEFNKDRSLLATLSPEEHTALRRICETIRQSQEALRQKADTTIQQ